jgi:hypothetical protein
MKRPSLWVVFSAIFFFLVSALIAKSFLVKIKTTHLRSEPQFYAQSLAVLGNGESVEQIETKDGWIKVKSSQGVIGWIHSSAVKPKRFTLLSMADSMRTEASADEVALAGKGFNKQVEKEYKARNPGISFALVDKMLEIEISSSSIRSFLKKGKLGEFKGEK